MKRRPLLFRLSTLGRICTFVFTFSVANAEIINSSTSRNLNGTVDGNEGNGFFVTSGTLTISNGTLQNFNATGGQGSGGGAALGGAVFVNSGATVILNNVNFSGNTVVGGIGGVGSTGGSLNNLFNNGTTGASGQSGYTPNQNSYTDIGGTTGTKGYNGSFNANGIGGTGGNGGNGGNGGDRSESLILGVTMAAVDLADAIAQVAAASANPFTANIAIGLAPTVINAGIGIGDATAALIYFDKSLSEGQIGLGGGGAAGGDGGTGGFGYGGGAGGNGGNGGTGGANWSGSAYNGGAAGGDAGDGGSGGIGGFGAGGGKGGDGGDGGGGAGLAALTGTPAKEAVYVTEVVPAVYAKGYLDPTTGDWVQLEGGLTAPVTGTVDHDNNPNTPVVNVTSRETSPRKEITYLSEAAQEAIGPRAAGKRPDGKEGGGGSGGSGGFGAGTGSEGDGTADGSGGAGGNGYGGAIFVRDGGTLIIQGDALFERNATSGGSSENGGAAGEGVGADLFIMKGSNVILDAGTGHTITFNGGIADDSTASIDGASNASGQGAGLDVQSGRVIFNAENTYTGQTKISGGVLQAQDGFGIHRYSNINLAGGVLQSNGTFDRFLGTGRDRLQWTGSGGFSAEGGDLTVRLNNNAQVTWGSNSFVTDGSALIFGSTSATNNVYFKNAIALGSGTRQILTTFNEGNTNLAFLDGVISGTGALSINDSTHRGTVVITAANTYSGGTTVNSGILALSGSGSLNSTGALTVGASGDFDISQTGNQTIGTLAGSGKVSLGDNTLTLNQDTTTTFSGNIADGGIAGGTGGSLTKKGSGQLILSGANTYTGTTQIDAGTITLTGSLESKIINVALGAVLNSNSGGLSSTAALTNAGIINLAVSDTVSSFTNTGTLNGTTTLTATTYALNGGSIINANLGTGTVNANGTVQLNGTSAASAFNVNSGTTTLGSAERLLDTVDLSIAADATLILGGAEKIASLFGAGSLNNNGYRLSLDDGSFSGVIFGSGGLTKGTAGTLVLTGANTYTGSTLINVGTVELSGSGSLVSSVINIAAGTTLNDLNGGLSAAAVVTNDGIFNIGEADDTIATLINTGTINGTATLTAATYGLNSNSVVNANLGTGIVNANGTVEINGTSAAATVNIQTGVTTLGSAERLLDTTDLTVSTGALLELGGDEKIGSLFGGGEISLQAGTLTVDDGSFSGVLSGTDLIFGLTKVSDGTLTLSGANTYLGVTQVNDGTLNLTGSLLSKTINVTVDGTLANSSGGFADDATATVDGVLILTADDTLTGLEGSGLVQLNNESLLTLSEGDFSGVISGNGDLTKTTEGTLKLSGENTFSGQTLIDAGTVELTGSLASTTVNIESGATLESTNSGLASGATVTNAGTLDIGDADDTVTTYNSTGTLNGTGKLTAGNYNLNEGSEINSNLGLGTMTTTGLVVLNGTSDAEIVNIELGSTLTLGGANLLSDDAIVTVGGTLNLGGVETIFELYGAGTINLNTFFLTVTNGGLFSGILNAGTTSLEATGGTLDLVGSEIITEEVNVTEGGGINLTDNGSIDTETVLIDEDSFFSVDSTSTVTTETFNVDGTLEVENSDSLSYNTLTGTGIVDADLFTNESGSNVEGSLTFTGDYVNEGRMAPGFSPEAITILGNYTESGTLEMELENTTAVTGHDQVRVGGTVTIDPGSQLIVQTFNGSTPAFGETYQIISDLAGLQKRSEGAFGSIVFDIDGLAGSAAPVANAAMVFDRQTSQLIATGLNGANSTFADLGSNSSQRNAAAAIFGTSFDDVGQNQIDSADALTGTFARDILTNGLGASANLARFAPEYYGSMADYAFAGNAALTTQIRNRVSAQSSKQSGTYAGWTNYNLETADSTDVNRNDGYVGGDYLVAPGVKVGGTFTYNDGDLSSRYGKGDVDGYGLSTYASADLQKGFSVFGLLGYSDQDFDLRRTTQQGSVKASTDASSFVASAGVRYLAYTHKDITIAPHFVLGYEQASVDSFDETGAVDALRNDGYDADRVTADLGASAVWETKIAERPFQVEAILGLKQVLSDSQDSMGTTIISTGTSYDVDYSDDDSTFINIGVNVGYEVIQGSTIYAGYDGLIGGDSNNKFNLGYRYSF